jgi:hypothetical protein
VGSLLRGVVISSNGSAFSQSPLRAGLLILACSLLSSYGHPIRTSAEISSPAEAGLLEPPDCVYGLRTGTV